MKKLAGFDLEIVWGEKYPVYESRNFNVWDYYPFYMSCAAVDLDDSDGDGLIGNKLFYSYNSDGEVTREASNECCVSLVLYLMDLQQMGYSIITHNGAAFDFRLLAFLTNWLDSIKELCLNSYDVMMNLVYQGFWPVGLDSIAKGMDWPVKTLHGMQAPDLWPEDYETVLNYVANDANLTTKSAKRICEDKTIRFYTKKGKLMQAFLPSGLLTVKECLERPKPDLSWMNQDVDKWYFWLTA